MEILGLNLLIIWLTKTKLNVFNKGYLFINYFIWWKSIPFIHVHKIEFWCNKLKHVHSRIYNYLKLFSRDFTRNIYKSRLPITMKLSPWPSFAQNKIILRLHVCVMNILWIIFKINITGPYTTLNMRGKEGGGWDRGMSI